MKTDEIMEKAHNKSFAEISDMLELLIESMRQYLSRFLMDTSEDNPFTQRIVISTDEDQGLSSLEQLTIVKMYQDPTEGIIYFLFEGCEEDGYLEFDDLPVEEIYYIIQAIEDCK